MDHYKETSETWNKIALLYQEKFMDLEMYNESYDFICEKINPQNAQILEIGCGPGNITKYILSKRPDFSIHGTDVAPNMIELAKVNCPQAKFDVMDCKQIDQLSDKYDGIICGFCLPYLSPTDVEKLLSDSFHLLNKNGLIYLSFVEGEPEKSGFQTGSSGDRIYFNFHSLDYIESLLNALGFADLKVFRVDYPKSDNKSDIHTILTAFKNY